MMAVSTDSWNSCENIITNSSAQVHRKWPEMLSGPGVFLILVRLNWRVTSILEIMISGNLSGGCQKLCAPGCKVLAVVPSVEKFV